VRTKRVLATVLVGFLATLGTVVGLAAPAQAAVLTGSLTPPSGLGGSGFYSVDTSANTLYISVNAGNMASGYCMTVYIDISRTGNVPSGSGTHYDARAARTCQPNSQRYSGTQYEGSTYGTDITGVQKLAICYGPLNQTGTCHVYIGTLSQIQAINPVSSSTDYCTRFWSRNSSGTNLYYGAGNVFSCSS